MGKKHFQPSVFLTSPKERKGDSVESKYSYERFSVLCEQWGSLSCALTMNLTASYVEKKDSRSRRNVQKEQLQLSYYPFYMHKSLLRKAELQQCASSLAALVRITEIISNPTGLQTELSQLFLSSSPGATRKHRNRETPYGFLDAHLF